MHRDERFSDVDWKQSIADRDAFPGLAVKVRAPTKNVTHEANRGCAVKC